MRVVVDVVIALLALVNGIAQKQKAQNKPRQTENPENTNVCQRHQNNTGKYHRRCAS